ncbi:hypothetical protein QZH41_010203, partial [Actinostola sp. cb2023]
MEHRRLWTYRTGGSNKSTVKYTQSKKGGKRPAQCTMKFMCLSKVTDKTQPLSIKQRTTLSNSGLGDASVTLEIHQNHSHTITKLHEKFPKLAKLSGGFELVLYQRAGEESGFHSLKPPYTPSRLKDICGQSKIYIRPLQEDIETDTVDATEECTSNITCLKCGADVPLDEMRQHQEEVHMYPQAK